MNIQKYLRDQSSRWATAALRGSANNCSIGFRSGEYALPAAEGRDARRSPCAAEIGHDDDVAVPHGSQELIISAIVEVLRGP